MTPYTDGQAIPDPPLAQREHFANPGPCECGAEDSPVYLSFDRGHQIGWFCPKCAGKREPEHEQLQLATNGLDGNGDLLPEPTAYQRGETAQLGPDDDDWGGF